MAIDCVVGQWLDQLGVAGRELEGPHAEVAGGHTGEHSAGLEAVAAHISAGRYDCE